MTLLAPEGPIHTLIQLAEETAAYVLDGADPLGLGGVDWPPTAEVVTEVCATRWGSVGHAGSPPRRHLGRILVVRVAFEAHFDPEIVFDTNGFLCPFPPHDTWVALCGEASDPRLLAWISPTRQQAVADSLRHVRRREDMGWLEDTDLPARAILGLRRHA